MKYTKIFFAALLGMGMTACSLDRTPLDPNTDTKFNKDAVFAKCYATFGVTGQKGPDGSGDVDGIDEGTSSFYRMFWELNEFCTDEGWWIWNDVGLADIRTLTWSSSNDLVYGLYSRLNFDITLCNSFLDNTTEYTDEVTLAQRAEVRMLLLSVGYVLHSAVLADGISQQADANNPQRFVYLVGEGVSGIGIRSVYYPSRTEIQ